jgi:hypothetical protein
MHNETSIRVRKLQILIEAIIGYKTSLETRPSHDYLQYGWHAYHHIAAFNDVIEQQQDGCFYIGM